MSGYAGIAEHMSRFPDIGSFRRFSALNHQNLLYLQAELTVLEDAWRKTEERNNDSDDIEAKFRAKGWDTLRRSAADWEQFEALQQKLKTYSE
jgi:hypothetical protein